jgi:hypothetical protein
LTLAAADPKTAGTPEAPKELAGLWEGKLNAGGTELRLVLRVEKAKGKETLVPVLDSPPVSTISLKDGELIFENKGIGGSYKGKLDEKKGTIEGTWSQGGQSFPLNLSKAK